MKTLRIILLFIIYLFLSGSCEKESPADLPDLSIDSLKILETNIPGALYTYLTFVDENTGFAVTNFGAIIKTTNSGSNWDQLLSPVNFFLTKIQFTDNQTGYIIGGDTSGGYLLKTVDSGQHWQVIDLHTPGKERPAGMFFLNGSTGFITGKRLFRKTSDGGQTWTDIISSITVDINDVGFKDLFEGYATSGNGSYFKTTDGGKTWISMQSGTSEDLGKIYFAGSKSFAKCNTPLFVDLRTGNIAFTVPDGAKNFFFLDASRCIGIGQHYEEGFLPYGDVFLTNDSWATFSQKKYNPQSEAMNVTAISKTKDGRILIIGCGTINTSVIELKY